MSDLPDFYQLEDTLQRVDAGFSASEVHGMACGVLVVDSTTKQDTWSAHVLKGDTQDVFFQEVVRDVKQLHTATVESLNANQMHFDLCLPNEQDPISERVEALQKWCQGFAFGLAASGLKCMDELPDDPKDWVQDVIKIGAATDLALDDDDESEAAYTELLEYLRVGVLMMNEELQPLRGMPHIEGEGDEYDEYRSGHIH